LDASAQAVIISDAAGTRGANVFNSIMSNFKDAESAAADASSAMGDLEDANSTYVDSISGKLAQLEASFQSFSQDLLSSDLIKFFVDLANAFVSGADSLLQMNAALPTLVGALTTIYTLTKNGSTGKIIMPSYVHYHIAT
jgi:hypothetical protein